MFPWNQKLELMLSCNTLQKWRNQTATHQVRLIFFKKKLGNNSTTTTTSIVCHFIPRGGGVVWVEELGVASDGSQLCQRVGVCGGQQVGVQGCRLCQGSCRSRTVVAPCRWTLLLTCCPSPCRVASLLTPAPLHCGCHGLGWNNHQSSIVNHNQNQLETNFNYSWLIAAHPLGTMWLIAQ